MPTSSEWWKHSLEDISVLLLVLLSNCVLELREVDKPVAEVAEEDGTPSEIDDEDDDEDEENEEADIDEVE